MSELHEPLLTLASRHKVQHTNRSSQDRFDEMAMHVG